MLVYFYVQLCNFVICHRAVKTSSNVAIELLLLLLLLLCFYALLHFYISPNRELSTEEVKKFMIFCVESINFYNFA